MNNFSQLAANRHTHLKVVAVALVFATLVVGIGFAAPRQRRLRHG